MRVEIRIEPDTPEPYAVLCVPELNTEIQNLVKMLKYGGTQNELVVARRDGRIFVTESGSVELVRTEAGVVWMYDRKGAKYIVDSPLHDMQNKLGKDFIRISKSSLVNIRLVDHISSSFNGTMVIVMKNGVEDYISRKYLREFKQRLGL